MFIEAMNLLLILISISNAVTTPLDHQQIVIILLLISIIFIFDPEKW